MTDRDRLAALYNFAALLFVMLMFFLMLSQKAEKMLGSLDRIEQSTKAPCTQSIKK